MAALQMVYNVYYLIVSPKYNVLVSLLLLLAECILVPVILWKIPYTEIDWRAYMQEVEGFLNGTTDYYQLQGDTGPLVYPAGFVYIYSILYAVTERGQDIVLAQHFFALLYLINLVIVFKLYNCLAKILEFPVILLPFLCITAYRVHSIYMLRLFNDGIAVTLLNIGVLLMIEDKWTPGCILYRSGYPLHYGSLYLLYLTAIESNRVIFIFCLRK